MNTTWSERTGEWADEPNRSLNSAEDLPFQVEGQVFVAVSTFLLRTSRQSAWCRRQTTQKSFPSGSAIQKWSSEPFCSTSPITVAPAATSRSTSPLIRLSLNSWG
ncbi:hypothetical protein EV644_116174 [Kribbella orskensis]|uniref:Uncharacterized protein n=1 Tax=Kribbella orskensis TaxID=2512216 RepID=A0ABY2BD49_9ACTN|nr:hypothetical protein EV642_117175 [Kribbella sp. VKM Ac-2500]TCO16800.1 hypothetical protein EV644_116174 [Kribbella orskensis]